MNVTETKSEGLTREYTVVVSKDSLAEKLEAKIAQLRPQMNLKGFRPGKVPVAHIRNTYGKSILGDIVQEEVTATSQKTLEDKEIRPAAQPTIELTCDQEQMMDGKADLEYSMKVELMPEFEPADVTDIELERLVVEVTDAEVDEALGKLAESNKQYEARGKTAKAREGDAVVIDFSGKIDGELFDGGTAEGQTIVLGEGRFIPGFEDQLIGAKTGQDVTVTVTFPEDYPAENLAGKEAVFETKVNEVRAPKEATIDEEFAKGLGIEDLATLKDLISKNIEQELAGGSRQRLKRVLLDALDERHDFDLPPGMVEAEFDQIWKQFEQEKEADRLDEEDKAKSEDELKAEYRKISERRVRLGLVLAEIGRINKVEIKQEEVSRALNQEASRYPGQEQQVIEFYTKTPAAMAQLRAPLFEEKVVDYIIERAKVTDKTVTREELEKALEEE
ncbi:trigger factor [Hirschia baltica]|uniref:Trigger factor n=1 Tax=Hirschia baltica (strain ATCC 49814 / DSM 5838 / IFAM 1418) TaxID=582402 RepID=C6XK44_HIRBI|nr:trigger factor [Hirschia baltica]ACT59489.1 trigger factor [Hirschia baltica ATCC 49814]